MDKITCDLNYMVEHDYSRESIIFALDSLLKERDKKDKQRKLVAARTKLNAAFQEYLIALGVDEKNIDSSTFNTIFKSFESEIEPALNIFAKVPKQKESRLDVDDDALESALSALRAFADTL